MKTEPLSLSLSLSRQASVRLLINYNKSHKAVVRVNPRVPLQMLLPAVCDKCEFPVGTTVLLRDSGSGEPLDLSESLNDLGLREVFAKDTAGSREHAELQRRPDTPEAAGVTSLLRFVLQLVEVGRAALMLEGTQQILRFANSKIDP